MSKTESKVQDTLNVMSFNILADNFVDFKNPKEYYNGISVRDLKLENRLPRILKHLLNTNADITLLQEVTPHVHDIIVKFMPNHKVLGFAKHKSEESYGSRETQYGNNTILKKGVFSHVRHGTYYLHKSGTAFSIVLCKHKATQKNVIIVNLHLDAYQSARRKSENAALHKFLKPYRKTHCIIVGGDFNTDEPALHKKYSRFSSVVTTHTSTYLCEKPMIDWVYVYGFRVLKGFVDNKPAKSKGNCMHKTLTLHGSDHYSVHGLIQFR